MKVIKCLIVDDEPPAIRLIEKYLSRVPFLELVSSTTSALTALIEEGGRPRFYGYSNARFNRLAIV
jgi:CheY-like chemotaxis protein